jgi:hypothetical protein
LADRHRRARRFAGGHRLVVAQYLGELPDSGDEVRRFALGFTLCRSGGCLRGRDGLNIGDRS